MDTATWITLGIALLGAGLGLFNTWYMLDQGRVKLFVHPGFSCQTSPDYVECRTDAVVEGTMFSIEISNRGKFPVTISEAGFNSPTSTRRHAFMRSKTVAGHSLPIRLDARDSITLLSGVPAMFDDPRFMGITRAYVRTACGVERYGHSEGLSDYLANVRATQRE